MRACVVCMNLCVCVCACGPFNNNNYNEKSFNKIFFFSFALLFLSFSLSLISSSYFTVPDHQRPRVCSLPDRPYNPRQSDDLYRLRTFSISKGTVVNCGDSIISRRSRSNTSVNSTTSRWGKYTFTYKILQYVDRLCSPLRFGFVHLAEWCVLMFVLFLVKIEIRSSWIRFLSQCMCVCACMCTWQTARMSKGEASKLLWI